MRKLLLVLLIGVLMPLVATAGYPWKTQKHTAVMFRVDLAGSSPTTTQLQNSFVEQGDFVYDTSNGTLYQVLNVTGPVLTTLSATGAPTYPATMSITAITASGDITANGNLIGDGSTIVTNMAALYLGSTRWDNGSSAIDGEQIAADTIDDDSIDFADVTSVDLTFDTVTWTNTASVVIDGTTAVTTNQNFLSATGTTNTLVIVDGLIKQVN